MGKNKNSRTGTITLEEAKFAFKSYYNTLHANKKKHIRQRAKKSDMQWIKEKKILYPNKKGSIKYLSEKGPRTFDFWGVDAFPKDTVVPVIGEDNLSVVSKGVGPVSKTGKSYSQISKENYQKRYGDGKKALVDNFWNEDNKKKIRRNKKIKWVMEKQDTVTSEKKIKKNKKIKIFEFNYELSKNKEINFRVLGISDTLDLLLIEFDVEKDEYKEPIAKIINGQTLLDDHSLIDDWSIKYFKSKLPDNIIKNTKKITDSFKNAVTNPKISLNYAMVELDSDELKELVGGSKDSVLVIDKNMDTDLISTSDTIRTDDSNSSDTSDTLENEYSSDSSYTSENEYNSNTSYTSDKPYTNNNYETSKNSDISDSSKSLEKFVNSDNSENSEKEKKYKNLNNQMSDINIDESKTEYSSLTCDNESLSNLSKYTNFSKCSKIFKSADNIFVFENGNEVKFADANFNNMNEKEKKNFFEISKKIYNLEEIGELIEQHGGKKTNFKKITNEILNLIGNN
tara:strand:- start:82 stop:1614 length:1533 start_codon:yes stop_codon:yes gene_type:complete